MNDPRERYFEFGEFRLDTFEQQVTRDGLTLPLTRRCYNLLLTFVRNGGHLLTHDELMSSVWEQTTVDRSSLKQNIATLRRALGDVHERPRYIQTVPKFGYRFIADITSRCDESLLFVAERRSVTVIDLEERSVTRKVLARWQAVGALVLVVAAIGVGSFSAFRSLAHSPSPPSFENLSWRKLTTSGNVAFAVVSPDAHFVAYVANQENGGESLRVMNVSDRSETTVVPAARVHYWSVTFTNDSGQIYFSNWDETGSSSKGVLYRVSTLGGKAQKVLDDVSGGVSFSPDGSRFLFTRTYPDQSQTAMMTADSADGGGPQLIASSPSDNPLIPADWSPDGSKILYSGNERREDGLYSYLAEMPVAGGDEKIIIEPRKQRFIGAKWARDGLGILLGAVAPDSRALQIYYVSYPDGTLTRITNDVNNYFLPNLSADARTIVATQQERMSDVWVSDVVGSTPHKITDESGAFETLAWAPDDRIVSDSRDDGRFHLWSMHSDGGEKMRITPERLESKRPAVSRDGKYFVFLSNREGPWQIWRTRSDGTEPVQITSASEPIADVHFGLDENDIIYQRYTGAVWTLCRISAGSVEPIVLSGDGFVGAWNVSPDGERLAYFVADGDAASGHVVVQSLREPRDQSFLQFTPADFLAFSPDGKSLMTKQRMGADAPQSTLWRFPLDGGKAEEIASNPPDDIYSATYSPDGKRLAWVQGKLISNIVLLTRNE